MKPRQSSGKLASLLLTAVLFVFLTVPALAVPYDFHYVWDGANVLSAQTEEHITRKNETLFRETGAQIAVVAVDFLDGKDIEDYTYDLFNTWGVGSTQRDNGFLLVMAIAEENYYLRRAPGWMTPLTGPPSRCCWTSTWSRTSPPRTTTPGPEALRRPVPGGGAVLPGLHRRVHRRLYQRLRLRL